MSNKKNKPAAVEPVLLIDSEVTRRIRQHARAHPKTEVCGVLIGDDANNTIDIRASIEGTDAAQGGTHVTFTQETWESIYRVKDELYPNDRIVGWYHSHPGFGVFLSEHDMFIQENFFSSPGQVAWVYDPHTDEEGCFGWVSGEVHRISKISIADQNGDGTERTPKSIESRLADSNDEDEGAFAASGTSQSPSRFWIRWMLSVLSYAAVLVFGFALSYILFPQVIALVPDPETGKIIVRDGHVLLPYIDGRLPWPSLTQMPPEDPQAIPPRTATFPNQTASRTAIYPGDPPMNDPKDEVLRVSLDEIQSVATPSATETAIATQSPVKSYGSIHEPAEPQIASQEKGNFFLNAWVYLGLAGLAGALAGWGIAEPGFVDAQRVRHWGNIWMLPLIVTLMCAGFALAESIVERSARKAAIRIGIALPLGVVLGFVFDFIANILFNISIGIVAAAGVQTNHNPAFWIARGLAWAVFGAAGGVVYGIVGQSMKKTGYGALGGAVGAALGGLIFDPISFATHGGAPSRAVGFGLLGLATGVAMGLVESALKDRWLYVTAGPLAGKQFILYKPRTTLGSIQTSDIYLFKDPDILPEHAALVQKAGRIHVVAQGPVYLGGQRISSSRLLESGSILQVGRYSFRYQEKQRS